MVRTQIYLDERQKSALEKLSSKRSATISDLIRQAVDRFISKEMSDFEEVLEESFGIWRQRFGPDESEEYVRGIRKEWEQRVNRS